MFDTTVGFIDSATGEMVTMQAHKVLLTAFSPVFSAIFEEPIQQIQKHPFIYIAGINRNDLHYLLNYIYNGEIDVPLKYLNSFLSIAKQFQIKGIVEGNNRMDQDKSKFAIKKSNLACCKGKATRVKKFISEKQNKRNATPITMQPLLVEPLENLGKVPGELNFGRSISVDPQGGEPVLKDPNLKNHTNASSDGLFTEPLDKTDVLMETLSFSAFEDERLIRTTQSKNPVNQLHKKFSLKNQFKDKFGRSTLRKQKRGGSIAPELLTCQYYQQVCENRRRFQLHVKECKKIATNKQEDPLLCPSTIML
jgi:hypothetical protein